MHDHKSAKIVIHLAYLKYWGRVKGFAGVDSIQSIGLFKEKCHNHQLAADGVEDSCYIKPFNLRLCKEAKRRHNK